MELSGLIFVALALVWAVVLIPKALKHHDDPATSRSADEVPDSARVLARREAVTSSSSRLVVTAAEEGSGAAGVTSPGTGVAAEQGAGDAAEADGAAAGGVGAGVPASRVPSARAHRAAAAAAARRRRRVLLVLLVIGAAIGGVTVAGLLPTWAPAAPAAAVLAFLVLARVTVRREHARWKAHVAARRAATALPDEGSAPEQAAEESADCRVAAPVVPVTVEADAAPAVNLDDTQALSLAALRDAEPTTDSAALWDPLPVTLPTYVGKPRATRSVRTIDLSAPGVASAGRDAAASALVAEAATAAEPEGPGQRAVGS